MRVEPTVFRLFVNKLRLKVEQVVKKMGRNGEKMVYIGE